MIKIILLSVVAGAVILIEIVSAIVFFNLVSSAFSTKLTSFEYLPSILYQNPVITLFALLLLQFFLLAYHNRLSQQIPLDLFRKALINQSEKALLRDRPSYIKTYFNKLSHEILMRLGFGYFSTLSYLLARSVITILMASYIALKYPEIFLISVYVAIPALLLTLMVIYWQRALGGVMSDWNSQVGNLISYSISQLTRTDDFFSQKTKLSEANLIKANALSQCLSNINKPFIEFILAAVFFYMALKGGAKINIDSVVLALLYRVYGNVTILISLSNLLSSSISSSRNLKHSLDPLQETSFPHFNQKYISAIQNAVNIKVSATGGYEIRGSSGVGKTLTMERMVSYYRTEGYRVFVWMNSIDFPDILVDEYIEEVLGLKKNILKKELSEFIALLPLNVKFSSLSLGQKSRLGILLSANVDVDIVFIDEPFANLDIANAKQYREALLELSTVRKVIISNHGEKIDNFTAVEFE